MNYEALKTEIETDPANLGYAALVAIGSDAGIAHLLNTTPAAQKRHVSTMVTARTLCAKLGFQPGLAILGKLEDQAANSSSQGLRIALKYILEWLKSETGLDVGHPEALTFIDGLRQQGLLDDTERNALHALSEVETSRAEEIFGQSVTHTDVAVALGRRGQIAIIEESQEVE